MAEESDQETLEPEDFSGLSDDEMAEKAKEFGEMVRKMESEIQNGYVGQEDVINKVLLTVVAGGNVLLEGVPGLGKSLLVELLARVIEGASSNRIQFTPDKLPSDIVGVEAYDEDRGFYVEKGPIFGNLILADEINRAPPKVQSAMLEAMQEHKVSIGDETFHLPEPFFTMATQNPEEQGGSLHPDETLYMDGQLWKAKEALRHAKQEGELVEEGEDTQLYSAGGSTNRLSTEGDIETSDAMVYEKDFEGEVYIIETRTGRRIKINDSHPLLVNAGGRMEWRKASELEEGDFLVTPETLDLPQEQFVSHEKTLKRLSEELRVFRREDVDSALEKVEAGDFSHGDIDALRAAAGMSKKQLAEECGTSYDRTLNYLSGTENGVGESLAKTLKRNNTPAKDYIESHRIHRIEDAWTDSEAGFFIGFTLAEGHVNGTTVEVSQSNRPWMLNKWEKLAKEAGAKVSTRTKDNVRHAEVRSKPFVRYLQKRYKMGSPGKLLSAPAQFKRQFLDAFLLAESHFEVDHQRGNYRVILTQKDRRLTNTVAYLLEDHGIRPKLYEDGDLFRLRITGKDIEKYTELFTWPEEQPETGDKASSYRVVPVNQETVENLVECLGLRYTGDMENQSWYPTYHMITRRGRVSEAGLEDFAEEMRRELENERSRDHDSVKSAARGCGIPMTDIVENTDATKHRVWQTYKTEAHDTEIEEFVKREREIRLETADRAVAYLENLVRNDVFYDPVQRIESEGYEGPVIGLSVPDNNNYVAGMGACGINHNTYPLPEAQVDRFLFKIYIEYPKKVNEQKIIDINANIIDMGGFGVDPVVTRKDVLDMQEFSKNVTVSEEIKAYIVDLVNATRNSEEYGLDYGKYIEWGCTPRASINMALASRAHAMYDKRHYVTPEDVRAVIEDVFIHRVLLNYEGEAQGIEVTDIIDDIVDTVPVR